MTDAHSEEPVRMATEGSGTAQEQSGQTASSEAALQSTFESTIREGEQRLTRSWSALLATGALGGIDVSMGVLGLLLVNRATGNTLVAALAFSIGFLALTLANSELFTENFLVPIAAIVARRASVLALVRLWVGALITNLLGGWIMMGIIMLALPELHPFAIKLGTAFVQQGIGGASFASAVLGGAIITLMTWMERGTPTVAGKMAAAVSAAFLLAAGHLNHAIVASLEMFAALHAGASFSYFTWAGLLAWYALGNFVGGVALVTMLRLIQVGPEAIKEKQSS
jgi:formate/nitrite transporter FocA (FNT family)